MRVLVADDSILFRRVMVEVLAALPDIEVVGQAANGKIALQKVRDLRPDLLTLDLEMPEMDGLAVLEALRQDQQKPAIIVVSALTHHGGRLTMQALQKGAFDFVPKPETSSAEESRAALAAELGPRLKALGLRLGVRNIIRGGPAQPPRTAPPPALAPTPPPPPPAGDAALAQIRQRMGRLAGTSRPELLLIGVSTGGPNALAAILPALPANLGVPVLIVQHMPPVFTQSLAENLNGKCGLTVCEAADGMLAARDTVYIAPGGRQMGLVAGPQGGPLIRITDDPPENNCRPAVDYLFRSVAQHFPGRSLAAVLTGMGSDGVQGLRSLKQGGCIVLAQDEASCVVYGMPKAAVDAGLVDAVLPLEAMAGRIKALISGAGA
jgi:two-component system, chemotaxis family, protein-glutamate methylesterase/glutaminase